jgi:hypothetical protein
MADHIEVQNYSIHVRGGCCEGGGSRSGRGAVYSGSVLEHPLLLC